MNPHDPHSHIEQAEPRWPRQADALRDALQQSADALDGASASRLNRARQAALQAASAPSRPWLSAWTWTRSWGLGLAATAALAVMWWPSPPTLPGGHTEGWQAETWQAEELNVLVEDADPELIADLEFYAWLDAQADLDAAESEDDLWEG